MVKGVIKNSHLFVGVGAILAGQAAILATWSGAGPSHPRELSTRNYFFYQCSSADVGFNTALTSVTLVYNFLLLCILVFLAFKTRHVATSFRESTYMFYTSQNILLSSCVVLQFAFFNFGESTLAAFVIKHAMIIVRHS